MKTRITKKEAEVWWKEITSTYTQRIKKKDPETGKWVWVKKPYKNMNRKYVKPGAMLVFKYQAKYASTLPFWDKHPLSIMFGETSRHLIGLNLHYIHPKFRPIVLKYIIRLNRLRIKQDKRFTLEYRRLKRWIKQHHLEIAIRKYIKGRMSNIRFVYGKEWGYAIWVPSEKFVFNGTMDRDKLYKLIAKTGRGGDITGKK